MAKRAAGSARLARQLEQYALLGISAEEMHAWRPGPRGYRPGMRLQYCGPLFAELDRPLPERVEHFLADPRPSIYVAITSSSAEDVRAVVEALRPVGVRILVAGTVHALPGLERADVLVEGVLPSQRIMPRVALAITAGGQGSVQVALASGTPLIAIPLQPEQDWNGQLVERQGAGRRISLAAAKTPKLAALARTILDDARTHENAQRVRAIYAELDGPASAADAIIDYAGAVTRADPGRGLRAACGAARPE